MYSYSRILKLRLGFYKCDCNRCYTWQHKNPKFLNELRPWICHNSNLILSVPRAFATEWTMMILIQAKCTDKQSVNTYAFPTLVIFVWDCLKITELFFSYKLVDLRVWYYACHKSEPVSDPHLLRSNECSPIWGMKKRQNKDP